MKSGGRSQVVSKKKRRRKKRKRGRKRSSGEEGSEKEKVYISMSCSKATRRYVHCPQKYLKSKDMWEC